MPRHHAAATLSPSSASRPRSGHAAASLALALVASVVAVGCYSPTDSEGRRDPNAVFILPDSDLSATLRDADGDEVEALDVDHRVGGTDCPQLLGTLTVDNGSATAASVTLAVPTDPPLAIEIADGQVEVAGGESVDIEIMFDCSATDDIETVMDLSLQADGRIGTFSIDLNLDVVEA